MLSVGGLIGWKDHDGTLLNALPSIGSLLIPVSASYANAHPAYILNLRGNDIPFNPVFVSYLYVGTKQTVLFIDEDKIDDTVSKYLKAVSVEVRAYDAVWDFLGSDELGNGKVLITSQTSHAIAAKLGNRFTVAPSRVDEMKAIKNETELEGFRKAYTRDSAAYVCTTSDLFSRCLTLLAGAMACLAAGEDGRWRRDQRVGRRPEAYSLPAGE
jgi:Xaa-Pro aminopeptidase